MSQRLSTQGLVMAADYRSAEVLCVDAACRYRQRFTGHDAETWAVRAAKAHAAEHGHRTRARRLATTDYHVAALASDCRRTGVLA